MEVRLTLQIEGTDTRLQGVAGSRFPAEMYLVEPGRVRYALPEGTSPEGPVLVWSENFVQFS